PQQISLTLLSFRSFKKIKMLLYIYLFNCQTICPLVKYILLGGSSYREISIKEPFSCNNQLYILFSLLEGRSIILFTCNTTASYSSYLTSLSSSPLLDSTTVSSSPITFNQSLHTTIKLLFS